MPTVGHTSVQEEAKTIAKDVLAEEHCCLVLESLTFREQLPGWGSAAGNGAAFGFVVAIQAGQTHEPPEPALDVDHMYVETVER